MALTVSTDLTNIADAETVTDWVAIGAQSPLIEPDFFAQGANCVSRAVSGAVTKGMVYDLGAGATLDFSATGAHYNKLIYIWLRSNTPSLIATLANGGLIVRIGSGAPAATDYKDWYVGGNDFLQVSATTGWAMIVIDPRAPASASGGTINLAALRYFGGAMTTTTTAKGQNFGIDRISYGRGELRVRGTVASTGSGIREMLDWDWGTIGNRYGILTERAGVIYCKGKLSIGDDVSTNPTDFSTENDVVVWEPTWYYHTATTSIRPTVGYTTAGDWNDGRDSNGVPYYGIEFVGNATTPAGDTKVQFGQKVGTGDTASGRNGPVLVGAFQLPTVLDADDGNVENVKIYGTTFSNFREFDFSGNDATTDEFIGNNVLSSGTLSAGPVELRKNTFIDGIGGAYRFMENFINVDATAAEALTSADPIVDWVAVVNGSNLSVPSKTANYVELLDPGVADRREAVMVTNDVVGSDDHYAEAMVRWPSAGANQGALGIFIRKDATAATENYWCLKADITNSLLSLIRCDAGTDTTVQSSAVTFAEDTDYLLHLRGSGTAIEGFCSGNGATTKLSATSSTYQTNRRVGIRGDAEADQTGDAPRLRRFGAGPNTDSLSSVRMPVAASQDVKNCTFINNARATAIHDASTHSYTGHSFSGNIVGVRNRSGGLVTINSTADSPEAAIENEGAGAVTLLNTKTISITALDVDNNPIQNAQVWVQKRVEDTDYGHPGKPFTSAAGNNRGDGDFVVQESVPGDLPSSGWLAVQDVTGSESEEQPYRYASKSGSTFTLRTAVTGVDNGAGDATTINETGIGSKDIVEGDTIRMTNAPFNWAVVLSVSANSVTTTPLSGGDSWASEPYGVHTLAVDYTQTTDVATVPLMNEETNASGIATEDYNYSGAKNVVVRVRRSSTAEPQYLPLSTQQQITATGLTLIVTLAEDAVR